MRRETFATPEPPRLELRLPAGAIEIATAATGETVVELEPLNERARRIVDDVIVSQAAGAVVVDVHVEGSAFGFRKSPAFRVAVRTPHGAGIELRTAAADLVALGSVGGAFRLDTVSGDVRAESIAGPSIGARSVSGDLRLGVRAGASVFFDVSSLSGETTSELEATDGPSGTEPTVEVTARSVSGDIRIVRGMAAASDALHH